MGNLLDFWRGKKAQPTPDELNVMLDVMEEVDHQIKLAYQERRKGRADNRNYHQNVRSELKGYRQALISFKKEIKRRLKNMKEGAQL